MINYPLSHHSILIAIYSYTSISTLVLENLDRHFTCTHVLISYREALSISHLNLDTKHPKFPYAGDWHRACNAQRSMTSQHFPMTRSVSRSSNREVHTPLFGTQLPVFVTDTVLLVRHRTFTFSVYEKEFMLCRRSIDFMILVAINI